MSATAEIHSQAEAQLHERRRVWAAKYPIRECYAKWGRMLRPWARAGSVVEVGAGAALMKEVWGEGLEATDILLTPWIDFAMDAQSMHLPDDSRDNILCIDAIHHFADPHRFIDEAARVVRDGGRLLFIEPWISPLSRMVYGAMHHECINFDGYKPVGGDDDPWAGNMAVPKMIFNLERKEWPARHPEWKPLEVRLFSLLDFQVAGGFKPWALVRSKPLYKLCLKIDDALGFAMPLIAFRILAVYERNPRHAEAGKSEARQAPEKR